MVRCAQCGRAVVKTAPVMLGRVPFGPSCAARLGIIRPRGPSPPKTKPRPLDVAAHEVMDGQLDLLDALSTSDRGEGRSDAAALGPVGHEHA